ncbi:alpha-N-arabinofuranosidase [Microbacterium testaceum]|nr:alpha-N-arabinofuranosidase [Microbacterium testaceum]
MTAARLTVDPRFPIGAVRRRLFGGFVEHLGRHVYDGIYEPGHAEADEQGFRRDVLELVRELGVSMIRYPGGNFVSGFRWEDSVGPREQRPRRLDLAWHSTETNEVGLHEFADWLDKAGSELMLAVNLGTRGVLEALDLLEYSNVPGGTALSQQRIDNGRAEPFDVRVWCLGNEMDGPWQLGHRSADDYGTLAAQTAKGMRQMDPSIELVVCGSSGAAMPTFGEWEREVLTHTYDDVDMISCHAYYQEHDGDIDSFLASAVDMDRFIEAVVATADHVGAVRGSDKKIDISFDEWNVWYIDRVEAVKPTAIDDWPIAPRLLEDVYSAVDAVVFGSLLILLLTHADRVASASLAQLVNVIAPIMTEPGGPAWRGRRRSSPSRSRRASRRATRFVCGSKRPRSTRPSTARCRRWMPWPRMTPRRAQPRSSSCIAVAATRSSSRSTSAAWARSRSRRLMCCTTTTPTPATRSTTPSGWGRRRSRRASPTASCTSPSRPSRGRHWRCVAWADGRGGRSRRHPCTSLSAPLR